MFIYADISTSFEALKRLQVNWDLSSITAGQAHIGLCYCDSDPVSIQDNHICRPYQSDSVEFDPVSLGANRILPLVSVRFNRVWK